MDLQLGAAIFQVIAHAMGQERQFARLAQGDQTRIKNIGEGRCDDEAPCLDANDKVDVTSHVLMRHSIDRHPEGARIVEEGCDVFKDDAFLWEIRDVPNLLRELFYDARTHRYPFVTVLQGVRSPHRSQLSGSTSCPC